MSTSLLQTKLFVPPLRADLVKRTRLTQRLDAGFDHKLSLLSAPAGFGKSTVLTEWAVHGQKPIAWLSLDKGDNEPARFWAYVVAALQTVLGGNGRSVALDFSPVPSDPAGLETMVVDLINTVAGAAQRRFALVLDDYHLITTEQIGDLLWFLLDSLPPQMHLILSSRSDPSWPLARLRARGELTELRAPDLRFTAAESAAFLNDIMGLELSAGDIDRLENRTEGWIAGLQMAALSMQGRHDLPGFISALSGSNRFIMDYLLEEVLDRQSPERRTFLLKTSILRGLTPSLCDAVTGGDDGRTMLNQLENNNLFLIPQDDMRRWYRYHHLFGSLLYDRLQQSQPQQVADLHRRAGNWYAGRGLLAEAMEHAAAAGDTDRQIQLIAGNVLNMAYLGELETLVKWLNGLPDYVGRNRPWFSVSRAWVLAFAGRLDEVEPQLLEAEAALDDLYRQDTLANLMEQDHVRGHVAALRGYVTGLRGEHDVSEQHARTALALLPTEDAMARGWTTLLLAVVLRAVGQLVEAEEAFAQAIAIGRSTGSIPLMIDILFEQSDMQRLQGRLNASLSTCQDVLRLAGDFQNQSGHRLPPAGYIYSSMAAVYYEWNDLDKALHNAREAERLSRRWGMADAISRSQMQLALVHQALGDGRAASECLAEAQVVADGMASSYYSDMIALTRAGIDLAQGRLDAVSHWIDSSGLCAEADVPFKEVPFKEVGIYLPLARLLLAQAEQGDERAGADALNLLERLEKPCLESGAVGLVIRILAIKALAFSALEDEEAALKSLGRALEYGESEGYVRTFIGLGPSLESLLRLALSHGIFPTYAGELLAHAVKDEGGSKASTSATDLVEPLTQRESEILHLLPTSLSTTEIATQLFVAPSTVRTHIKGIYGKLDVHERVAAVDRARELGLL